MLEYEFTFHSLLLSFVFLMSSLTSYIASGKNVENSIQGLYVTKRSGAFAPVKYDKITHRIEKLCYGLDRNYVDSAMISQKICSAIYKGVSTKELDELTADTCEHLSCVHPDFGKLAARIAISNLHKSTLKSFSETCKILYNYIEPRTGLKAPMLADYVFEFIQKYANQLNLAIDYEEDFKYDYFGFKTLERGSYLFKVNGQVVECPQHMLMRVAIGIYVPTPEQVALFKSNKLQQLKDELESKNMALYLAAIRKGDEEEANRIAAQGKVDLQELEEVEMNKFWSRVLADVLEYYDLMSHRFFTPATPTLFNAGTRSPQCSSCFVAGTKVHTINGVKNIEDVMIGDEVVTHTGEIKKVSQLHKNELNKRQLYDLKVFGTPTLSVTGNHRFWSISKEQLRWNNKPTWNSVDYLRVGDYIAIPKKQGGIEEYVLDIANILPNITGDGYNIKYDYTVTDDKIYPYSLYTMKRIKKDGSEQMIDFRKKNSPFNRFWKFDNEMMEVLGMWYGDGCIYHEKNSKGKPVPHGINIVQDVKNAELIELVTRVLSEKIGATVSINKDHNNQVNMAIHSKVIATIFKHLFGSKFNGKRLPSWINELDYKSIQYFLAGLVSTDGCVASNGAIQVQLSNPPLMEQIFAVARSVGIPVTLTIMHKENSNAVGRMNVPGELMKGLVKKYYEDNRLEELNRKSGHRSYVTIDGQLFLSITSKTQNMESPEHVYTFGVDDVHSYSVGGLLAENCFLLDIHDDSIDGIYKTLSDCAKISKKAGGIGVSIHKIRAGGSYIKGTSGTSNGIIPMLRVFNTTAKYVDQGGNKRKGAFACFCADTEVLTMNAGVKKIQDVQIGDLVVTHKNRVKPVVQVHKNPLGERKIYKLKVERSKDVYVTGNHKFWSFYTKKYKDQPLSCGWNSIEELKNLMDNPQTTRQTCYIRTPDGTGIKDNNNSYINVLDYEKAILNDTVNELKETELGQITPISKYTDGYGNLRFNMGQNVNKIWKITEDVANLFGIWLGDGNLRKFHGYLNGIQFTVHKDNHAEIDFITKVCEETFGCNANKFTYTDKNVTSISVNSHIVGAVFHSMFGEYFNGKSLPDMFFKWPKNLVNSLIAGLITTDGHITKTKYNATLGLSNENLINQLHHLCRSNGIEVSFVKGKLQKGMTSIPYTMSIPLTIEILDQTRKLYYDNRIVKCRESILRNQKIRQDHYLKILEISETDRNDEYVYTLGIEEDHSYTVEGLVCQNCYIEPWHKDIFPFLDLKKNQGVEDERARDLFYALWIPNIFMQRVAEDGNFTLFSPNEVENLPELHGEAFDKAYIEYEQKIAAEHKHVIKARDLWQKILETQTETGIPYMLYKDACNFKSNHKNLGTIHSSNLCVKGNTMVLTQEGQFEIQLLSGKHVNVWNGQEWSNVQVMKTGENQKLLRLEFSNGSFIECTDYHKFYNEKGEEIRAVDLKPEMKLEKCPSWPIIDGKEKLDYPYTHGLYCAEGFDASISQVSEDHRCEYQIRENGLCYRHQNRTRFYDDLSRCQAQVSTHRPSMRLYGEKANLVKFLDFPNVVDRNEAAQNRTLVLLPDDIAEKFYVPINASVETKLRWFEGFCDGDGTVNKNENNYSIQCSSINKEFLLKIRLMLQTLGIDGKVCKSKDAGMRKIKTKEYYCQTTWKLLISSFDLQALCRLGFSPNRLSFVGMGIPNREAKQFTKVISVSELPNVHDTYCFNEPKLHRGIFNGIRTGQCCEIVEYTSPEETAVCNLHSIALPMFLNKDNSQFDFQKLFYITKVVTKALNKVIDINDYPTEEARRSNMRNRPIGIGVQGLADLFILMHLPFESAEARKLNKDSFETMYFAALTASCELAEEFGHYESMRKPHPVTGEIAPIANGVFQFELHYEYQLMMFEKYGATMPGTFKKPNKEAIFPSSGLWDWEGLRAKVLKFGVRNSLLLAPMPTASTSQILGNTESFEPITSNIYVRRTLAGEFVCPNKHLLRELLKLGIWNVEVRNKLIANNGSVQKIAEIPNHLKSIYKTTWEISQKVVLEMAADRQAFIDQSQSLNIHMTNVNNGKLSSMHFTAWALGLKTGMYYLRSKPAVDAVKFTIDPKLLQQQQEQDKILLQNRQTQQQTSSSAVESKVAEIPALIVLDKSARVAAEDEKRQQERESQSQSRSLPQTQNLTNAEAMKEERDRQREIMECSLDNPENCLMCGS